MRFVQICVLGLVLGCGSPASAPSQITLERREAIRQNLQQLGARVTADVPEGLYLSLRNTHVEIRELGGLVEGSRRSRNDILDFCFVNEAVAKSFIDGGELDAFRQWLRQSLSTNDSSVPRAEYGDVRLTISKSPLRTIFSPMKPSNDE